MVVRWRKGHHYFNATKIRPRITPTGRHAEWRSSPHNRFGKGSRKTNLVMIVIQRMPVCRHMQVQLLRVVPSTISLTWTNRVVQTPNQHFGMLNTKWRYQSERSGIFPSFRCWQTRHLNHRSIWESIFNPVVTTHLPISAKSMTNKRRYRARPRSLSLTINWAHYRISLCRKQPHQAAAPSTQTLFTWSIVRMNKCQFICPRTWTSQS